MARFVLRCAAVRVAFVLSAFPVVSQLFIVEQIAGLLDLGVDVEIFAARPPPPAPTHDKIGRYGLLERTHYHERPGGIAAWRKLARGAMQASPDARERLRRMVSKSVSSSRSLSPRPAIYGLELLERPAFEVVHVHFGPTARLLAPLRASGYAAPLVTTFHGFDANVEPRKQGTGMYRFLFRVGDLFTVNSRFLERRLVSLGCDPARIELLPMGVDLDELQFAERTLANGSPVKVLSVARLVEAKGIESAIRAVASLIQQGRNIEYRVVGDGELERPLSSLVSELGVGDRIQLVGAQPHQRVRELYRESHLFVLPSVRSARGDEETQGVVVQEAQASGMPVIVSDVGGIREGIAENRSGVVFPAGDAEALARAIDRLMSEPARWPTMGRVGRDLVQERYARSQHCRRLLDLYGTAIRTRRLSAT